MITVMISAIRIEITYLNYIGKRMSESGVFDILIDAEMMKIWLNKWNCK